MPPPNFFTRATRIFQNTNLSTHSEHSHLAPDDSSHQLHYETDGSSYEMLIVESPSKSIQVSQQLPQSKEHHLQKSQQQHPEKHLQHRMEQQPNQQTQPDLQEEKSENPMKHLQSEQQTEQQTEQHIKQQTNPLPKQESHQQPEPRTPPRTPPPRAPAEPQTPSQKLPVALRRIGATPVKLPETPGYNLRPRTRSQAPPTPLPKPTPTRSRRRERRQAPSARTTSGIAGRPSILSRSQIDNSSYVTLRALCRGFGLPTSGTKAELRARAIDKFEHHRVLDEQTQPLDNEDKLTHGAEGVRGVGTKHDMETTKRENEENSGQVRRDIQMKANSEGQCGEQSKEICEQESGKQITTSTVKPAGRAKYLAVEATIAAESDEPSVHAKSDAPEDNLRRQAKTAAECSTANSPAPAAVPEAQKVAQPTVSSTGAAVNSPDSPRPPPPHPTPRLVGPPCLLPTQRRHGGPTESVDARGGGVDVAVIFQELASGRRKLSHVEYEAALKTLKDNAPDRMQPMQIPINAARVSLNAFPTTPTPTFKPPPARPSGAVRGVMPSQRKLSTFANNFGGSSSLVPMNSSNVEKVRTSVGKEAEKSDRNKPTIWKETEVPSETRAPALLNKAKTDDATQEKLISSTSGSDRCDEVHSVESNRSSEMQAPEQEPIANERIIVESEEEREPSGNDTRRKLESGTDAKPQVVDDHQNPIPSLFEGADGGPHKGHIVGMRDVQKPPLITEGVPNMIGDGSRGLDSHQEGDIEDKQDDQGARRSGFATPREMVRRFNRLQNDDLNDEEHTSMGPYVDDDPATSFRYRKARRSSSGVPLFFSVRGPSTAGRSILKTKSSFKAREAQDHLRRMDRLHNLSGRASFRVKRPLSASAGALLVDLRRASTSSAPVERMDQRGSFQAELARRPPPMAASALKILNELQQIQQESRAQASRKRAVSPPPLPPSVLKRARRGGQFAPSENDIDRRLRSVGQKEALDKKKNSNASLPVLDRSLGPEEAGSSGPVGRQIPRIPPVAYGTRRQRSKRSKTSRLASVALADIESHAITDAEKPEASEKGEANDKNVSMIRTKRRQQREVVPNLEEKAQFGRTKSQSKDKTQNGVHSINPSTFETLEKTGPSLFGKSKVERRSSLTVPANATERDDVLSEVLQVRADEQYGVSANPADKLLNSPTGLVSNTGNDSQKIGATMTDIREKSLLQKLPRTEKEFSVLNKDSSLLQSTSGTQDVEQKFSIKSTDGKLLTAVDLKKPSALQEQNGSSGSPWDNRNRTKRDVPNSTNLKQNTTDSAERHNMSEAWSPQVEPQDRLFKFQTKQHPEGDGAGEGGLSVPSFAKPNTAIRTNVAFPTYPFGHPMKPFSVEGKSEEENASKAKLAAGISIPSKASSSFESFAEKEGSSGVASAPSIPSREDDGKNRIAFGVSSVMKPIQTGALSERQENEQSSSKPTNDSIEENRIAPTPIASQSGPKTSVVSFGSKESTVLASAQATQGSARTNSERPMESIPQLFPSSTAKACFTLQPDGKSEGLPKGAAPVPKGDEPSVNKQAQASASETDIMAAASTPPSTSALKFGAKSAIPNPLVGGNFLSASASNNDMKPIACGPFSKPVDEAETNPAFSFTSAPKAPSIAPVGPVAEGELKPPASSPNSGNMFVFGSGTRTADVKPAPSLAVPGDSATPAADQAKTNLFAQVTGTAPFGSQPTNEPDGIAQSSGRMFGMSSSTGQSTTLGPHKTSTAPSFGPSFGSSAALFNVSASSSFLAASTTPVFGASSNSKPSVFGSVNMPATPFGTTSGPAIAPTFGTSSAGPTASNVLGAPPGGASASGFGSASSGSFTFGNPGSGNFGASDSTTWEFITAHGLFGRTEAAAFNMGSATRAPPTQRRRLRGRRTLR